MLDRNELILEGLAYTVMGILVVFMILVIIMMVIKAMALFSGNSEKEVNASKKAEAAPAPASSKKAEAAPAPAAAAAVKKEDDSEIVAVITAAIYSMLGESATGFRIRSYRRVGGKEWNKAGRREVLDNRF